MTGAEYHQAWITVPFVRILEQFDRVITAPRCISLPYHDVEYDTHAPYVRYLWHVRRPCQYLWRCISVTAAVRFAKYDLSHAGFHSSSSKTEISDLKWYNSLKFHFLKHDRPYNVNYLVRRPQAAAGKAVDHKNIHEYEDFLCQKQLSWARISDYIPQILWGAITYPYPSYMFQTHQSSYMKQYHKDPFTHC